MCRRVSQLSVGRALFVLHTLAHSRRHTRQSTAGVWLLPRRGTFVASNVYFCEEVDATETRRPNPATAGRAALRQVNDS